MSLGRRLLDALDGPGTVTAEADGVVAEVDVVDADRLGVRVGAVRLRREQPRDLAAEARRIEGVRSLPERVVAVEVDPGLGGAVLRTHPADLVDHEYTEIGLGPRTIELRRVRGGPGIDREPVDVVVTRGQLGRLLDELGG